MRYSTYLGIPLSGMGTIYGLSFNYLCLMSFISHWRAAWADPGIIPKNTVSYYNFKITFLTDLKRNLLDQWILLELSFAKNVMDHGNQREHIIVPNVAIVFLR